MAWSWLHIHARLGLHRQAAYLVNVLGGWWYTDEAHLHHAGVMAVMARGGHLRVGILAGW